jgi:SAM-dependent methyltransferase
MARRAVVEASFQDDARRPSGSQQPPVASAMTAANEADDVDVNRRYFVWYVQHAAPPGARVLDFGCGAGTVVRLLRDAGYEAYGVDVAGWGLDQPEFRSGGLPDGALRYYEPDGRLPFDDDSFDVIVSDQVLEHVVGLEHVVSELERVLKPGGVIYHHFPSRRVIREPHIGTPFAHRLPNGRLRLYYAAALRRLGVGWFKDDRPPLKWAEENLAWVDDWTVYRRIGELHRILGRNADLRHREIDYCRFRAGDRAWLAWLLRQPFLRSPAETVFRRLAFEAIEVRPQRLTRRDRTPSL